MIPWLGPGLNLVFHRLPAWPLKNCFRRVQLPQVQDQEQYSPVNAGDAQGQVHSLRLQHRSRAAVRRSDPRSQDHVTWTQHHGSALTQVITEQQNSYSPSLYSQLAKWEQNYPTHFTDSKNVLCEMQGKNNVRILL